MFSDSLVLRLVAGLVSFVGCLVCGGACCVFLVLLVVFCVLRLIADLGWLSLIFNSVVVFIEVFSIKWVLQRLVCCARLGVCCWLTMWVCSFRTGCLLGIGDGCFGVVLVGLFGLC